jgi:hypothetical protein
MCAWDVGQRGRRKGKVGCTPAKFQALVLPSSLLPLGTEQQQQKKKKKEKIKSRIQNHGVVPSAVFPSRAPVHALQLRSRSYFYPLSVVFCRSVFTSFSFPPFGKS